MVEGQTMDDILWQVCDLFERTKKISDEPKVTWSTEQSFQLIAWLSVLFKFLKGPSIEGVRPEAAPLLRDSEVLVKDIQKFIRSMERKIEFPESQNITIDENVTGKFISRFEILAQDLAKLEYPELIKSYSLYKLHTIDLESDALQFQGLPTRVRGGLLNTSEFATLEAQEKLKEFDEKIKLYLSTIAKTERNIKSSLNEFEKMREKASSDIVQMSGNANAIMTRVVEMEKTFDGFIESKSRYAEEIRKLEDRGKKIQTEIESRKEAFVSIDGLIETLKKRDKSAEEIISNMRKNHSDSKSLGLSKIFTNNATRITKELFWTQIKTFISTVFLFVFSIPLIGYVVLPLLMPFLPSSIDIHQNFDTYARSSGSSGWDVLSDVIIRVGVLLPAAWLFLIWNKRYNILLQLREHYQYKSAIALSIEDLKGQSKRYTDEIITHLVTELASDPARIMSRGSNKGEISDTIIAKLVQPIQDPISGSITSEKKG